MGGASAGWVQPGGPSAVHPVRTIVPTYSSQAAITLFPCAHPCLAFSLGVTIYILSPRMTYSFVWLIWGCYRNRVPLSSLRGVQGLLDSLFSHCVVWATLDSKCPPSCYPLHPSPLPLMH